MSLSIRVIPKDKLYVSEPDPRWFGNGPNPGYNPHWTNENWLKSRFHFSFAEYRNPSNQQFGVMHVMNDDLVQPDRGFGTHPHQNMEIITYVVHGQLTHQDTLGTQESLGRGSIQFMTAGTGIEHSEFNKDKEKPLRFIQTWIVPSRMNLKPNYGSYQGVPGSEKNRLLHLVSNVNNHDKTGTASTTTPVQVNQDVDCYASELELGRAVTLDLPSGRQGYLLCIEGKVKVNNGHELSKYDACEIIGGSSSSSNGGGLLTIEATETETVETGDQVAHILLFTMAHQPGKAERTDM